MEVGNLKNCPKATVPPDKGSEFQLKIRNFGVTGGSRNPNRLQKIRFGWILQKKKNA